MKMLELLVKIQIWTLKQKYNMIIMYCSQKATLDSYLLITTKLDKLYSLELLQTWMLEDQRRDPILPSM